MHSVLMDFLLFVLLDITLYGRFLGLHSLDIGKLSQICKGLLVVLADAILRILGRETSGMSLLGSAPFPVVLIVHEFPLRSNTLLRELSILCLTLVFLEALLHLRAKGWHLIFLFGRYRGNGIILLLLSILLYIVNRSAVETLHSMLLSLGLLHWSPLFRIALTSTTRHNIYALHRRRKLVLEVGDLILQLLQMGGLNS